MEAFEGGAPSCHQCRREGCTSRRLDHGFQLPSGRSALATDFFANLQTQRTQMGIAKTGKALPTFNLNICKRRLRHSNTVILVPDMMIHWQFITFLGGVRDLEGQASSLCLEAFYLGSLTGRILVLELYTTSSCRPQTFGL